MLGPLPWRKSSFSVGEGQCVEVAAGRDLIRVRESDDPGVVLTTVPRVWRTFVRGVKAGGFDRVAHGAAGPAAAGA
ncbi:DUF397 domain-containing protein [Streptomyces sp. B1866]|uniref:DUF397 domain-containing protein n=1 Tax=Streptomyces sp. B1866 TaxID=3075431 RepID=UPI00288D9AFF|nr:DUF397 domain-containing protein [Streptomyces sp. B1866]MDT3396631.1 DUF397 domain-containing protein [Streptomyces sp. B1866]